MITPLSETAPFCAIQRNPLVPQMRELARRFKKFAGTAKSFYEGMN